MKKWLVGLLIAVLVISVFAVTAFASGEQVTVALSVDGGNKSVTFANKDSEAQTINVKVAVTGSGDKNIGALVFVVGVPDGCTMHAATSLPESGLFTPNDGKFTYSSASGTNSMEFTIPVTVSYEAARESGNLSITVDIQKAADIDEGILSTAKTEITDLTVTHTEHDYETHGGTTSQTLAPSCTANGTKTKTCICGHTETENISKLGHDWSGVEPTWQFNDDRTSVTVTLVCKNNTEASCTITKTGKNGENNITISDSETLAPKCDEEGTKTFTATYDFTSETGGAVGSKSGTATLPIQPKGHTWQDVTPSWNATGDKIETEVKATCSEPGCKYNSDGYPLSWSYSSKVTKEPTCEATGTTQWTATASIPATDGAAKDDAKTYEETNDQTTAATGHAWGEPDYTWDDTTSGEWKVTKATITCAHENCDFSTPKTQTLEAGENLETTSKKVEPTYETAGSVTYTVTAKFKANNSDESNSLVKTDSSMVEPLAKLEAPKPSATVESEIVSGQGAAEGSINDAAGSVIDAVLDAEAADPGEDVVDKAVVEAIQKAGTSERAGSMSVSTELVVDEAPAQVPADVTNSAPEGAELLNISIKVTVSSTDSSALDASVTGEIHQVETPIQFTVDKPADATGPIFYVARYHDGQWTKLETTISGDKLQFKSDKFSYFAVVASNDIAAADIADIADQPYTGSAVTPKLTVTINNGAETLKENVDYTLSYEKNTESGAATVTVTGMGRFSGKVTKQFTILDPEATQTPAPTDTPAPTETPAPSATPEATNTPEATKAPENTKAPSGTQAPGSVPETGDETPLAIYACVLVLCAAALGLVLILRKRHEK